ncbi:hypothetical protein [Magnetospirillum sp. ME-1]|uniref:hypothetical protein n=1 Tax=Magnetospirillum sp. ME-1 TaxID=1639348 RepID=UPI0011AE9BCE|nr:hypothetical protein [Magnetospirillum sp. ME-1]
MLIRQIVLLSIACIALTSCAHRNQSDVYAQQAAARRQAEEAEKQAARESTARYVVSHKMQMSMEIQKAIEDSLRGKLKDPESARFKHYFVGETGVENVFSACGEVNAKNSYGGYVGSVPYSSEIHIESNNGKKSYYATATIADLKYVDIFFKFYPQCDGLFK